ncbi:hypothetical protein [Luteolibacter marinus]|uniref:hypothetical protein n=1 Tax=Luteolibacter marinus TaxID=2776705 RepID=UPI0018669FB6|nr:hypothetical protein [Luteolibacter marinus]
MEDAEHLKLLSIFHYVMTGLCALGGFFPGIYIFMGGLIVSGAMDPAKGSPPPPGIGWLFVAIGAGLMLLIWGFAVAQFLAARWIGERKNRVFCFVIAGLNCALFPLGTALGVFTILVLQRASVAALFDRPDSGGYLNR